MEYFSPKDFSLGANFPENRDSKGEPISAKDLAEPRIRKVCVGIRWNLIRFNSLNCQNKPPMNEKSKSLLNIALPLLKQLNGLLLNCFAERQQDTRAASKDNQSRKEKNFPFSWKD